MSSDSDTDKQYKVTNEFKKNVLSWVKLDDQIREMRAKTKTLTKEKKEFESFILTYLEQVNEKVVAIADGKLRRNVSKTKAPLKKASIMKALMEITGDNTKAIQMTEHIFNSRPEVERINLKRTKNRKK